MGECSYRKTTSSLQAYQKITSKKGIYIYIYIEVQYSKGQGVEQEIKGMTKK